MRSAQIFVSGLHLFVLFLIFAVSFFLIGLFWAESFRNVLIYLLFIRPLFFAFFGFLLFFVGILLFLFFYVIYKPQYLTLRVKNFCAVNTKIISDFLFHYWKEKYPTIDLQTEVFMEKKGILTIKIAAKKLSILVDEEFLQKTKEDLSKLLAEQFDYKKDFDILLAADQ